MYIQKGSETRTQRRTGSGHERCADETSILESTRIRRDRADAEVPQETFHNKRNMSEHTHHTLLTVMTHSLFVYKLNCDKRK